MKVIFISLMLFISQTFCYAQTIQKDIELIDLLKQKNIQLIVIRHGEALHNLSHLMCSNRSPAVCLTETGISQIETAADLLSQENINFIYVSPVYRTLQTAQIIAMTLKIPFQKVCVEEDLREQPVGIFENRTYEEYEGYFTSTNDLFTLGAPEGETGEELFLRSRLLLWRVATKHFNETILLVTHAYNCCQIHKCLTDAYGDLPGRGEFRKYNFN